MGTGRAVALGLAATLAAVMASLPSASSASSASTSAVPPPLRTLATAASLRLGATVDPSQLADADITAPLAREFSSVTAENAMKWYSIEPNRDQVDFSGADAVLAFAESHDLTVRGHNLVWAQDAFTPAWIRAIGDRAELQAEVDDHIRAVLERYRGRIHRWDVVNEPLDTLGTKRSDNVFDRVLGPGWIADAYRLAHEVDPDAELWLNEYGSDWSPGKHAALLALLRGLLADGVPIDGIGLQTHRLSVDGPDRAVFERQLRDYADLGLRVAITELDVAVSPTDPAGLARQAEAYRTIVVSCLAVPACDEVTTWGVSDRDTWLDGQGILPAPTRPLLFDDDVAPKPAYDAVAEVLGRGRAAAEASSPLRPGSTTSTTTATTATTTGSAGSPRAAPPAAAVPAQADYTG